jgi:transcriptional regulator with PAS, ATPase and Fis domain
LEICGEGAPLDFQLILASTTGESEVVFHQVWSPKVEGLKVIDVHVPPLRQRKEDVSALAAFFVQEQRREGGTSARGVSSAVLEILERHRWPGNVRELKNVIEFAGIQAAAQNTHEITPAHLPHTLLHSGETTPESFGKYNYRYHLARTEVWLTHLATIQHKRVSKTDLARELGYNDRFVLTRRLQRNFRDFPSLVPEFPDVAELFGVSVPR